MAMKAGYGEDRSDPVYVVELREEGGGAEVAIIRIPAAGEPGSLFTDVWVNRFASLEAARAIVQLMMARPDRWALWAKAATRFGQDFVAGLIELEVIAETRLAAQASADRRDAERLARRAREARTVQVSLVLDQHGPRIVASRGVQHFLVMRFESRIEARRVWDWVRWQRSALQSWFALSMAEGTVALERLIFASMLEDEKRASAAGWSAGGRRPLRYWRPPDPYADADEPDEPDDPDF